MAILFKEPNKHRNPFQRLNKDLQRTKRKTMSVVKITNGDCKKVDLMLQCKLEIKWHVSEGS